MTIWSTLAKVMTLYRGVLRLSLQVRKKYVLNTVCITPETYAPNTRQILAPKNVVLEMLSWRTTATRSISRRNRRTVPHIQVDMCPGTNTARRIVRCLEVALMEGHGYLQHYLSELPPVPHSRVSTCPGSNAGAQAPEELERQPGRPTSPPTFG